MIPLTTENAAVLGSELGNERERSVLKRPATKRSHSEKTLSSLIPEGRLSEVEGHGATSAIVRLVAEAQSQGEPVAWITGATSSVHPPDLAAGGIHLHSLAFLRIADDAKQTTRLRAAELILRSGAFALVVIEAPPAHDLPARALSRLHAMARRYNTRVVFRRCHHSKVSLGPLIGLKIHVGRQAGSQGERLIFRVQKNKAGQALTSKLASNTEMRLALQMPDGFESAPRVAESAAVIPFASELLNTPSSNNPPSNNPPSNNPAQGDLFEAFRLTS